MGSAAALTTGDRVVEGFLHRAVRLVADARDHPVDGALRRAACGVRRAACGVRARAPSTCHLARAVAPRRRGWGVEALGACPRFGATGHDGEEAAADEE